MNGRKRGSPSRTHSMMSLSVRPQRRLLSARISRSQSFAGVVSTQERGPRSLPVFSPPIPPRKPPVVSRVSRMFSMAHKTPPPKVPQPERLDQVYEALKRGLTAYLEVHQLEQEKLNIQIRESKRNSRLGFVYDLDKQVKSVERFLRRLEFHASKIDELYEGYCIQRRLRDGAQNMVRAYSTGSPGSREARDSLAEASRGHREYMESMCLLESELEGQLGEFHIKMKGLAGFARLCAGDQYEICMKYGRQRWKLRGRIEGSGKQVWDSEEMVFLPLLTEFLSIKVTELKSLANHVVVGSVACETRDLFAARPQVVAVDINDLGTIKLSLEVTWNPFDKDDQPSAASTVTKASTVSKRLSAYSQSPPDTPSLREQAFYNMLRRQEELENGAAWSLSSESSDDSSSPQLSGAARLAPPPRPLVQQAAPPAIHIAFSRPEPIQPKGQGVTPEEEEEEEESPSAAPVTGMANGHAPYSRTLSHISEVSLDAVLTDTHLGLEPSTTESLARGEPDWGPALVHHVPLPLDPAPLHTAPSHPDPATLHTASTHPNPAPQHTAPSHSDSAPLPNAPSHSNSAPLPNAPSHSGCAPLTTTPSHPDSAPPTAPSHSGSAPSPTTPSHPDPALPTTFSSHPDPAPLTTAPSHPDPAPLTTAPSHPGPAPLTTAPSHPDPAPPTTAPSHPSPAPSKPDSVPPHAGPVLSLSEPATLSLGPTSSPPGPSKHESSHSDSATLHASSVPSYPVPSEPTDTCRDPSPFHLNPAPSPCLPEPGFSLCLGAPGEQEEAQEAAVEAGAPLLPISPSGTAEKGVREGLAPIPSPFQAGPVSPGRTQAGPADTPRVKPADLGLEEALSTLSSALDDYRGQFPELQGLEQEVKRLEGILMQRQGTSRSRASSLSLTVEHALESFSFLNTPDSDSDADLNTEEDGLGAPADPQLSVLGLGLEARGSVCEDGPDPRTPDPLSTGCESLDVALVLHLQHCSRLLLKLGTFGPLRCREASALERLLREAQVLELMCQLSGGQATAATSAQEVVQFSMPRPGFLPFWDECVEGSGLFVCPAERLLRTFCHQHGPRLAPRQPGLPEAVGMKLLEDALGERLPRRPSTGPGPQITLFQFWSHIEALGPPSLEAFATETAEEVVLVRNLLSDDQAVVLRALQRAPEQQLQREGLRALSSLLVHGNGRVIGAVSNQLRSLALGPIFRHRALLCFLDQLEDEEAQIRVAGCVALGCLRAPEGIEPLVYLCQTDKEAVREAARQGLLQCGEDGKSAYRRLEESLDTLPRIFGPGSMASTAF
ncbi:rho family-interacting cell polarization regulator 1 isoform X1 [Tachyglossus aculeatus]|uniref:rho family-interacting cell polarization regulator 1 isoform X1 n=2 Tax=Tachyglossus aculeatus TaxID=9261 RepID=UPI0018F4BA38|nr:rho family-interacting cell polarization regulator 1 isoform X1 [Tachyglossus aculeatus]